MVRLTSVARRLRAAVRARRADPLAAKAGYSLLEILIVLSIIALIAALVGPRLFAQLDRSKATTARVQARSLQAALNTMRLDIGRYPTAGEGLTLLTRGSSEVTGWYGPYLDGQVPNDPWGRPYQYRAAGEGGEGAEIVSLGADGRPGGSGLNTDIVVQASTPAAAPVGGTEAASASQDPGAAPAPATP